MSTVVIPSASYIIESAVIPAPLVKVWTKIKLQSFAEWLTVLKSSSQSKSSNDESDIFDWVFLDGSSIEIKQEAKNLIDHSISYSIISANPALTYHSCLSTISLREITSGSNEGHTFIEWSASFSSDAGIEVTVDASFKRKEALADLAKSIV